MAKGRLAAAVFLTGFVATASTEAAGQSRSGSDRLRGFDEYIQGVMHEWNVPGLGIAIVVGDGVVLSRGYGYRDYGRKLPFTTETLIPIASNTKLFTAIAAGLLVQEGQLVWDSPLRQTIPELEFSSEELNRTVTLRDMLAHRTGLRRQDNVWFRSNFSREELLVRVKYLEAAAPPRSRFIYNNHMYAAAGYAMERVSGSTWEELVRTGILEPLGMTSTTFTVAAMRQREDHAVPYALRRDTLALYEAPFYEGDPGIAPAGAMISNLDDMTRWLLTLVNGGKLHGRQVLPASVIDETLKPSLRVRQNVRVRGRVELTNPAYGLGRWTATYRSRQISYHGGDLPGFHSQVSVMPRESIGVVVLLIGDHAAPLYNAITFTIYDRLLGLPLLPWTEQLKTVRQRNREILAEMRRLAESARAGDSPPSLPLAAYAGEFSHPVYGPLQIGLADTVLTLNYRGVELPLYHFENERFETLDDERDGWWTVTFASAAGEVQHVEMPLDHEMVVFTRRTRAAPAPAAAVAGRERPTPLTPRESDDRTVGTQQQIP
jgi:CubicO group peptidase (beta-lactamase class C family)